MVYPLGDCLPTGYDDPITEILRNGAPLKAGLRH